MSRTFARAKGSCCRFCFDVVLRPSRRQSAVDNLMSLIGQRPARCPACSKRFYVFTKAELDNKTSPVRKKDLSTA